MCYRDKLVARIVSFYKWLINKWSVMWFTLEIYAYEHREPPYTILWPTTHLDHYVNPTYVNSFKNSKSLWDIFEKNSGGGLKIAASPIRYFLSRQGLSCWKQWKKQFLPSSPGSWPSLNCNSAGWALEPSRCQLFSGVLGDTLKEPVCFLNVSPESDKGPEAAVCIIRIS